MKKTWSVPEIETLELAETQHSACPETRFDNTYGGYEDHGQECDS